jgi:glycosyltransferase involved in cell wall biosynthesis
MTFAETFCATTAQKSQESAPVCRVAVVVPCYNQAQYVRTAADSVLVQSFGEHELILVNDGSTDDTAEVLRDIVQANPGRRIRIIDLPENGGLSAARNAGIAATEASYILPLDADDFLHPMALGEMVVALDGGADIVATGRVNFGACVDLIDAQVALPSILPLTNQLGYCSMFRRVCWQEVGGYPDNYPKQGMEDWEFWLSCMEGGFKFAAIPKVLWYYRVRTEGMASDVLHDPSYYIARVLQRHPQHYLPETLERAKEILADA